MSDTATFLIQVEQMLKGASVVTELEKGEAAVRESVAAYRQLETEGEKTAKALAKNAEAIASAEAKLGKIGEGDKKGAVNVAAYKKQEEAVRSLIKARKELMDADSKNKSALGAQRDLVSKNAGVFEKLRGAQQKTASTSKLTADKAFELKDAFNQLGGPAGSGTGKLLELGESFSKLGKAAGKGGVIAGGLVIAVALIAAVTVAVIAGTAAILKYGITLANTARQQRLTTEAFLISVEAGSELAEAMKKVERSTGVAGDRQKDIVRSLKEAKVPMGEIPTALEAIAKQEAALGDSAGTAKLIESLKTGEKTARQLGDVMEKQYGGIVAKKMMGLDQSSARFGKNLAVIFGGLNIETFLEKISAAVDMFDQTHAAGRALKTLFETVFQPLVDAVATSIPYIQLFFLRFARSIVVAATPFAPLIKKVQELFDIEPSDAIEYTLMAATAAAALLVAGIGAIVLVSAAVAAALVGAFAAVAGPVIAAGAAIYGVYLMAKAAYDKVTTIGWSGLGKAIIDGIVAGIKAAGAAVANAVGSVVDDAISAAKKKLRIKSPSRVFYEIGEYTSEGMAEGVEAGSPSVQASMSSMVKAPAVSLARGGGKGLGGAHLELHVHLHGASRDDGLVEMVKRGVIEVLEGASFELGLAPEEA